MCNTSWYYEHLHVIFQVTSHTSSHKFGAMLDAKEHETCSFPRNESNRIFVGCRAFFRSEETTMKQKLNLKVLKS